MPLWKPIDRRTLLRGLLRAGGAVAVGLPFLEAALPRAARAACDGVPKRFGVFFWGNGNLPERWRPTGEGYDWALSEQLAPLAGLQHKISVLTGMDLKMENFVPHTSGAAGILTGSPVDAPLVGEITYRLPTIDQVIAEHIGGETIYRSLQTSATAIAGLSYNGPYSVNPHESSPYALYERLFGATFHAPGEEVVIDPRLALRQSALDAVMSDMDSLMGRVGSADRVRLEQHFDGIRELEQRLARLQEDPPDLAACQQPAAPLAEYPDVDGRPQLSAINRAMCDLLAMALACDQTRVFFHVFTEPVTDLLFPDSSAGHHDLTHNEPDPQEEVNAITIQCMEELAYLLQALDGIDEGEGTLLDHCAVLATSDVSEGRTHAIEDMPLIIGGSACGALKAGYCYQSYSGENASSVLLTLAHALDVPLAEIGDEEGLVSEGLSDLEA